MSRQHIFLGLTGCVVAGHALWFCGNLYEAVVLAPRFADPTFRMSGVLAPGSPVRYYLPWTPLTLLAAAAATLVGWRLPGVPRATLAVAEASSAAAVGVTAHLVRNVNRRLFFDPSTPDAEVRMLSGRWVRLNRVRLVIVGTAGVLWTRVFLLRQDDSAGRQCRQPSTPFSAATPQYRPRAASTSW